MIQTERDAAAEELVQKCINKRSLCQAVAAASLRKNPGLTEEEKYRLTKRKILDSWSYRPKDAEEKIEAIQPKTVDALLAFKYNDEIEWAFKTRRLGYQFLLRVESEMKQAGATREEIDSAIKWAILKAYPDYILKVGHSKAKGLSQERIESFLTKARQRGDVIGSITIADMREIPGLTTKEIEELAKRF